MQKVVGSSPIIRFSKAGSYVAIPPINDIKRMILEVLADGRERSSAEIHPVVARRLGLSSSDLERRPPHSNTTVFMNWHAHGLKLLQDEHQRPRGLIVRNVPGNVTTYKITRYGRSVVRHTPLPPDALAGEAAHAVATIELLAGKTSVARARGQGWRLSAAERHAIATIGYTYTLKRSPVAQTR